MSKMSKRFDELDAEFSTSCGGCEHYMQNGCDGKDGFCNSYIPVRAVDYKNDLNILKGMGLWNFLLSIILIILIILK